MPYRSLIGSVTLLTLVLLVNGCGSSEAVREAPSLRITAINGATGEPLDSARVWNRRSGDTVQIDSAGQFILPEPSPALYVFDIDGYGFHQHRHLSLIVEPGDSSISINVPVRPKQLTIDCRTAQSLYREDLEYALDQDSNGVRLRLLNTLARNGEVQLQPAVVNNLSAPVFVPDNFGAFGHYTIRLFDEEGKQLAFEYKDAPSGRDHRIYAKRDILPVVPNETERLQRSTLVLQEEIEEGTTLYAQMEYDFSLSDTLRATEVTNFPSLHLDSLRYPLYDTLRVSSEIQAADSLVVKQDTTVMKITGIDTTVSRGGHLLYSTFRDSNATRTAKAARSLLFVPDSVKGRVDQDSLDADRLLASSDPEQSNLEALSADPPPYPSPHVVLRTNRQRLDSLITDKRLVDALSKGLPEGRMSVDSLLNLSDFERSTFLSTPDLPKTKVHRGITSSSFLSGTDSSVARSLLSLSAPLAFNGTRTLNSISSPAPDSIPLDSLPLTIPAEADSFVTDSVVMAYLSDPPNHSYWYVPESHTAGNTRVMVIDSTFKYLRARPYVDTTTAAHIENLIPDRIGQRDSTIIHEYPQQVLATPTGGYRTRYLQTWEQLQGRNLQEHYCQIYPYPLETLWRTSAMH